MRRSAAPPHRTLHFRGCSFHVCTNRTAARWTTTTHPNPVTRQIMAPEAGLNPRLPPPPGNGLGGDCLFLPSHDPEPAWNSGLPIDPAAHFRFQGLPPHIRRKCVRPGEEGRRARDAGGSCPRSTLPRLQSRGTAGQGRSKGVGCGESRGREDTDSGLLINTVCTAF
ncbi:hypothetical protein P7K49_012392 [Saguinus oedipus]|uniref:Uncharacterized protein n=1 Tax=Saguinus oedipus TaxID=9490 RepID=A0ABQ9VTY5_SAGOE|nr:hypothetical protein P7K49_012392 [Saguinus oedipus]